MAAAEIRKKRRIRGREGPRQRLINSGKNVYAAFIAAIEAFRPGILPDFEAESPVSGAPAGISAGRNSRNKARHAPESVRA